MTELLLPDARTASRSSPETGPRARCGLAAPGLAVVTPLLV